jgi:hypothetical protein
MLTVSRARLRLEQKMPLSQTAAESDVVDVVRRLTTDA